MHRSVMEYSRGKNAKQSSWIDQQQDEGPLGFRELSLQTLHYFVYVLTAMEYKCF